MTSRPPSDHPGLDTWIGYRAGELPPGRRDELQDHLVDCAECLALVRDLAAFEAAEAGPPAGGWEDDPAVATTIDSIVARATAGESGPAGVTGTAAPPRPSPAPRLRPAWVLPLAAGLLVALAVGSLLWGLTLRSANRALEERVAHLSGPLPGAAVEDLYADGVTRNGRGRDASVTLPRETPFVTWLIHLPPGADAESYRGELAQAGGRSLWRGGGLTRDPRFHTVRLGMPGDALERGRYVLRLWPEGAPEGSEPAAVYELDLRRDE